MSEHHPITGAKRPRIFISYKRQTVPDEAVAMDIYEALSKAHHVFIDQLMLVGTHWVERIEQEIRNSDFLITLLSEESVQSEMVITEVERARACFSEQGRPRILPVRLAYHTPFDYRLSAYLNDINWAFWETDSDTPRIIDELMQAVSGKALKLIGGSLPASECDRPTSIATLPAPLSSARPVPLEQPGGTMDPHSAFYVERAADRIALQEIEKQGVTITIKGPRQVGKSSLLEKVIGAADRKMVIFLDFQQFDAATLREANQFYPQFCHWIWRESGASSEPSYEADQKLGHVQRTSYFMQELVSSLNAPIVLALDEVERLFASEFRSDFFGMLRSWHNARRRTSSWRQLDIVLVTSTEPYLFIDNDKQSPFNVGEVIELGDFNLTDLFDLNKRHGNPLNSAELDQLVNLVGAHPYLIRKALFMIASGRTVAPELFKTAVDDYGPFGDHLRTLLFHLHDQQELVDGMRQITRHGQCADDRIFHRLRGAGLVRRDGKGVTPRCNLYSEFFRRRLDG
jgi:AAA-like domain/TIR domain